MRLSLSLFTVLLSGFCWAQNPDFLTGSIQIEPNWHKRNITGQVVYNFKVRQSVDSVRLDAVNMAIQQVRINKRTAKYRYHNNVLAIAGPFHNGKYDLEIQYIAQPKQAVYFTESPLGPQIWTQGQGKENSHWVPSFNDPNEKIVFEITALTDPEYTFIANGEHRIKERQGEKMRWKYALHQPISSYLLAFTLGHFQKQIQQSKKGVVIENYYEVGDSLKVEPTYRYTAQIMDFLEKETGYAYPWGIYRNVPLRNFLYGGMENATMTTFNRTYMVDEVGFNDVNYVNVNAHEMAHHWFGDLVTAKNGKHHWLQEGFATYFALLAEKEIFGEDYFIAKLYRMASELEQASQTDHTPILHEKASSLSYYQKGAWALHDLRSQMGAAAFQRAVSSYLKEYAFQNVETADFLKHVAKESSVDIDAFTERWLTSSTFPEKVALELLAESPLMQSFFEVANYLELEEEMRVMRYEALVKHNPALPNLLWEEMIFQWNLLPVDKQLQLFSLVDQSASTHAKLVWLYQQKQIPQSVQKQVASWLDSPSYILQEMVLDRLCREFTADCPEYLNRTKTIPGLNDFNVRQVWLTLALKLNGYQPDQKIHFYEELLALASSPHEFNTRMGAIEKLLYLNRADENVLPLLAEALTSHNWQFSKFAREHLRKLLQAENYRQFYEKLLPNLPQANQSELQRLLNEKKAPE